MSCTNECDLAIFISVVACAISQSSSEEELEWLTAVLTQLADTFDTILVQRQRNAKLLENKPLDVKCMD